MDALIKDGSGSNRLAKVNGYGQLHTKATIQHNITDAMLRGDAYFLGTDAEDKYTLSQSPSREVLFVENLSDRWMVLSSVIGSVTAVVSFWIGIDQIKGEVGNYNVLTPINKLIGSQKTPEGNFWIWDKAGNGISGLTGGVWGWSLYTPASHVFQYDFDGGLILPKNHNFCLYMGALDASTYGSFYMYFYMMDPE